MASVAYYPVSKLLEMAAAYERRQLLQQAAMRAYYERNKEAHKAKVRAQEKIRRARAKAEKDLFKQAQNAATPMAAC